VKVSGAFALKVLLLLDAQDVVPAVGVTPLDQCAVSFS
jgi:hypothetical protein